MERIYYIVIATRPSVRPKQRTVVELVIAFN